MGLVDVGHREPCSPSALFGACIHSRATATCSHVAVAAPRGSEDEEDEEARRAGTGRAASPAAGA